MLFSSSKIIGVDLGSNSVKFIELEPVGNSFQLVSFHMAPTPLNSISNGQITDTAMLAEPIRQCLKEAKTKTKKAATGMWGGTIIIKKISIPKVEKAVLDETIRFEAEQYIPFDINSVALTYVPLSLVLSGDTMEVLVIAAKSDEVVQYIETLSLAGLQCGVLDANGIALANCFELNYGKRQGETIAIFNFGAEVTTFVVIYNGELIFCRELGIGGASITAEIARSLGISPSEAESFKISAIEGAEVPDQVHAAINSEVERMVDEIKNSVDFFGASNVGINIGRVFYSGGGSHIPALIQQVAIILGVNFEKLDPFKAIKIDSKKFNLSYIERVSNFAAIAIGLAAREVRN